MNLKRKYDIMIFLSALKMEFYKVIRRSSTKLLLIFVALPLFYGISNIKGSQAVTIEGSFSALAFGSACWGMLGMTGLANILFIILISNHFGKEKEDGQLKFILLEIANRKKVLWAKVTAVFSLIFFSYILLYIASIIVYYTCMAGSVHGSIFIDGMDDIILSFSTDFLYLIQLIMIASIEILICMYYKSSVSLLLGVIISMIFIVLQYVPIIKFADPIYIAELFNSSKISTLGIVIYGSIYLCFAYILILLAMKKFKRSEIK
ncbi:MAG: ABC transporter permease [Candidatus Galacturonibacter soehngenii]|nr:ABC transporter permease [Candidatus Galacturonibacter soehngenii]